MKKLTLFIIIFLTSGLVVNAQKQSGTIYSEHDGISKTKAMWAAFLKGDKQTYLGFYADSVWNGNNGSMERKAKEQFGGMMDWWNNEFKNLAIADDKPSLPDALQFKDGGLFVQDWIKLTGTHEKTGINLNWPIHNIYHFNDEGKVDALLQYYDPSYFTEIFNSQRTIENGVVYKFHPLINTVRKAVNAYCTKNADEMLKYYSPDAAFSNLVLPDNRTYGIEEMKKEMTRNFENQNSISMIETGHPVCVCYEKESYVVYSWWLFSYTTKQGVKKTGIPIMMTNIFNPQGKIMSEAIYYSTNHFE